MILCEDEYPKILDAICAFLTADDVELCVVDSKTMQEINRDQRGLDKTTDVLSFPLERLAGVPLGSIVINTDLVQEKSAELGHAKDEEFALLFTHGLLHILGFDHEIDDGQMRQKECEVIAHFNLPKSLIVRTMDD